MNVSQWGDQQLDRFGEFDAIVDGDRTWTNRRAHDAAARFASLIVAAGVGPGDRILLWLPVGADVFLAFTGCLVDTVVGGTHYSVIRPPLMDKIARDLGSEHMA